MALFDLEEVTQITAPIKKGVATLFAAGGAGAAEVVTNGKSFLPDTLMGWVALFAAIVALFYNITMYSQWWWVNFWKPWLRRRKVSLPAFMETEK